MFTHRSAIRLPLTYILQTRRLKLLNRRIPRDSREIEIKNDRETFTTVRTFGLEKRVDRTGDSIIYGSRNGQSLLRRPVQLRIESRLIITRKRQQLQTDEAIRNQSSRCISARKRRCHGTLLLRGVQMRFDSEMRYDFMNELLLITQSPFIFAAPVPPHFLRRDN